VYVMDRAIKRLLDLLFIQNTFHVKGEYTSYHRQGKAFQRARARDRLFILSLGHILALQDIMIGIEGNLPGLFAAGCFAVGIKAEGRKAVRKYVIGLDERLALPVQRKVPVASAIPAVLL